jgi:hypothetical protein
MAKKENTWDFAAKDAAASKVSKKEEDEVEDMVEDEDEALDDDGLRADLQALLDGWDDEDHPYYKDVVSLIGEYSSDEDEDDDVYEEVAF